MVVHAAGSAPMEVHGADGQVVAYLVSAEQMKRLRGEIASLTDELGVAAQILAHYRAREEELLRTRFPLPPSPGEMATPQKSSSDIARLIAELGSR